MGSSLFGAQLAAQLGLPYAFASHFAPDHLDAALAAYRAQFRPSAALDKPHTMAVIGILLLVATMISTRFVGRLLDHRAGAA